MSKRSQSQYIYETTPKKIDYRSPQSRKNRGSKNNSGRPVPKKPKPIKQNKNNRKQQKTIKNNRKQQNKRITRIKQPNVAITHGKATVTHGKAEVAIDTGQSSVKKISKSKVIAYIIVVFSFLFLIGYRNTIIDETFVNIQKSKSELALLEKENQQLKIKIEDGVNLDNIEKIATEKLGMRKLSNSQKIYLTLPKRDYIEPASEKVMVEEESWFTQIIKMLQNLF